MGETSVDMTTAMDTAKEAIQEAAVPSEGSLTKLSRAASPVVPAPGVGQVGLGQENSWGLEEDVDEEDDEEETQMEEQHGGRKPKRGGLFLECWHRQKQLEKW